MERNFSSPVFYVKAKWRSFVLKECALSCRSGRQFRTKSLEILVLWFSTYTHTIVKHLAWVIVSKLIYLMVLNSSCAIVIDRYDCWDQFNHCWFQNINFFWSVSHPCFGHTQLYDMLTTNNFLDIGIWGFPQRLHTQNLQTSWIHWFSL